MDVTAWLRRLGLEQYAPAFRDNDVDSEVLPELTADDLISIGVTSVGHRRKLLAAIAALEPTRDLAQPSASPVTPPTSEAERRQLTVMFCDMIDSTYLSTRLDPEDLSAVIRAYQSCVAATIASFDGFIARYVGDGVLIYFGYPRAHENDAERAVRAALAVIADIGQTPAMREYAIRVRIGIATGLVVIGAPIGTGEARQQTAIGETPNLAARLQALAEPDAVVIADGTRRLLGNLFELKDLGATDLKGIAGPTRAWAVLRASSVESRFDALHATGLTALVGREDESELLLRRWSRAKTGEGQVVLLSGEAGIGKSRLTTELLERLSGEPCTRLRYFCSPQHQDSALYPFVAQLEHAASFAHEDTPAARLDTLEALLAQGGDGDGETAALFADLLGLPAEGRYPPLPQEPQRRREMTLAALLGQFQGLARQQPVLLLFEDAHWADATSLELLDRAVERLPLLPVLMVVTFRPEYAAPWVGQAQVTTLALNRLGERESGAIAGNVAGGKRLPAEILAHIVERTDGIPLFVEELTKSLIEGGLLREEADGYALTGPLPPLAIPASLHASLMARLDRLTPVKELAQIGAAIGREFSYELLAAVARRSEPQLVDALDQLVAAGLISRRGTPPRASFAFKHALIQDAAYSTLLRSQRQGLHARLARVLEGQFTDIADAHPEIVAHHYTEAGLHEQAVNWLSLAAAKASATGATREATSYYERALAALGQLPSNRGTIELGVDLRLELRNALASLRELVPAFNRVSEAEALARSLGDGERLARTLTHKTHSLFMEGRLADARVAGEEALAVANTLGESSLSAAASQYLGQVYRSLGDYPRAIGFFRANVAALTGDRATDRLGLHAYPSILARVFLADCEANIGNFGEASQYACEAGEIADIVDHGLSRAAASSMLGSVRLQEGDVEAAIRDLERASSLCRTNSVNAWIKATLAQLCLAYALAGRTTDAQPLFEEATQWLGMPGRSEGFSELSHAALLANHLDLATKLAELGLQRARANGERGSFALCINVFGKIELARDRPDFEKAVDSLRLALAEATELGMGPLVAHSHVGLAKLHGFKGERAISNEHFSIAEMLYRKMKMAYWLRRMETEATSFL
jgi:class 3 adenylate cyclase/tetratricopeptide (TPR) repeat protein